MTAINVGVDFGSTYTTVSIFDTDMNFVKAISLESDNPYVPSVVARDGNKFNFGRTAKAKTKRNKVKVFKAFKMLLPETDSEKLLERNYDPIVAGLPKEDAEDANTPVQIARRFLEYLLKKTLDYAKADSIQKLVIGIPEIWNEVKTYGGRTVLRDICSSFPFIEYKAGKKTKDVQVISEPACASAFIAYKYLTRNNGSYDGKILLIDYGGGTLDITLSSVTTNSQGSMEIRVLEKKGAGENVNKKIGQAGIIYMETVIEEAIKRTEGFDEVEYDSDFYTAVNDLEMEMIGDGKSRIEDCFEQYNMNLKKMTKVMEECIENDEDEEDWLFTTLEYHREEIQISYALLLETYNWIIYDTLDEQLNEIMEYMASKKILYSDGTKNNFKIAIVGGFGKYYPVIKQVEKKFGFGAADKRRIEMPESDSEQAISLGAALLAEGLVKLQKTSSFSLGVLSQDNGKVDISYAIKYKQDIIPGDIYFTKDHYGGYYVYMLMDEIKEFLLNFGPNDTTATKATLKDDVKKSLRDIETNVYHTALIGFSFDESEVITMHVVSYDPLRTAEENLKDAEDTRYVLSRFEDLFSISRYTPVK